MEVRLTELRTDKVTNELNFNIKSSTKAKFVKVNDNRVECSPKSPGSILVNENPQMLAPP
jgi:hypothetical protein